MVPKSQCYLPCSGNNSESRAFLLMEQEEPEGASQLIKLEPPTYSGNLSPSLDHFYLWNWKNLQEHHH